MTGDRSRLRNFVTKFIGTVRFGNDHFGAIMGYGNYVFGDSVISRVYYVERLGTIYFLLDNSVTQILKWPSESTLALLENWMELIFLKEVVAQIFIPSQSKI